MQVDDSEYAHMKQVVTLTKKVQLARKVTLWKIVGEEESAEHEHKNVTQVSREVYIHLIVVIGPEVVDEKWEHGECPQHAARSELKETLGRRIRTLEVGLSERVH